MRWSDSAIAARARLKAPPEALCTPILLYALVALTLAAFFFCLLAECGSVAELLSGG